jgi:hypothetical protein
VDVRFIAYNKNPDNNTPSPSVCPLPCGYQNGAPVAGLPSCSASQLAIFQQYRDKQLAAIAPALQAPHTGAFVDSCFVHEQNVDYCSGQSLPNCLGWNVYNVSVPEVGQVTMDDTYYGKVTVDGQDRNRRRGGGEKGHEACLALLPTPAKHPYPGPDHTHYLLSLFLPLLPPVHPQHGSRL